MIHLTGAALGLYKLGLLDGLEGDLVLDEALLLVELEKCAVVEAHRDHEHGAEAVLKPRLPFQGAKSRSTAGLEASSSETSVGH